MPNYVTRQGDCISSIAKRFDFFWETIWNHPKNDKLKAERQNPNAILEGDIVYIPDKSRKQESGTTDQSHRFRLKGVPAMLRMRFRLDGEPLADEPYRLVIDNTSITEGSLASDGLLDVPIQPDAKEAVVTIGEGDESIEYDLVLGNIDPASTLSGLQQRLSNLGFPCEGEKELGDSTRNAIKDFQSTHGSLAVTGEPDRATIGALVDAYGL